MMSGVGLAMPPALKKWNNPIRPIESSGILYILFNFDSYNLAWDSIKVICQLIFF